MNTLTINGLKPNSNEFNRTYQVVEQLSNLTVLLYQGKRHYLKGSTITNGLQGKHRRTIATHCTIS